MAVWEPEGFISLMGGPVYHHGLGRRDSPRAVHDQPVVLGTTVPREVEDRFLVGPGEIEVTAGHAQLVAEGGAHGYRLAGGRNDLALPDHVASLLPAALGHPHHPRAVLVGAGLHGELVVEVGEEIVLRGGRIVHRRVVAQEHHLHALQPHHPIRPGPAPIVADAEAHQSAEGRPDSPAEVAHFEVTLLQMLKGAPRLVLGMTGEMDLAVFADGAAGLVHQDRGVEASHRASGLTHELGVAETEADAETARLLEERTRLRPRHLTLEERVDLRLVLHPPAREEGRKGKLGKHHEVADMRLRLLQEVEEALHHLRARLRELDGPELRRAYRDHPAHDVTLLPGSVEPMPEAPRLSPTAPSETPAFT